MAIHGERSHGVKDLVRDALVHHDVLPVRNYLAPAIAVVEALFGHLGEHVLAEGLDVVARAGVSLDQAAHVVAFALFVALERLGPHQIVDPLARQIRLPVEWLLHRNWLKLFVLLGLLRLLLSCCGLLYLV